MSKGMKLDAEERKNNDTITEEKETSGEILTDHQEETNENVLRETEAEDETGHESENEINSESDNEGNREGNREENSVEDRSDSEKELLDYDDENDEHNLKEDTNIKRAERRKRRKRNQIIAYLSLTLFVVLIIALVVLSLYYIKQLSKSAEIVNAPVNEQIESIIGTEETLVKPEETETIVEKTPEEKLDEIINAAIEVMPIEDKVAGLFMVTPEAITGVTTATQAGEGTQKALNTWAVGGIIYFKKNMSSVDQLKEMINNTSLYSRYPIFIAVDEEGGKVSRVADAKLAENVGSAETIGQTQDPAQAYAAGQKIGSYLYELGFNVNLAPVADINNIDKSVIGDRAYGSDSSVVSSMVSSMVSGLEEQGVSACLKHFPGIGNSTEDTHKGMATSERTADEFRVEEFVAFKAGMEAGADFVMVSHLSVPAFTGDNTPCSLSKVVVTDILRDELGYRGIIITDAMNMSAITEYQGADEAAIRALKAGCDMILMPENFEVAYNGVLQAVSDGTISEERINDSLRRIYRVKYADKLVE